MELTQYVDALRVQLSVAGSIGGPQTAAVAERLADTLDSAARLALQQAVCDAAEQITQSIAPGAVEVRLRGQELDFVTTLPMASEGDADVAPGDVAVTPSKSTEVADGGEAGTARITFRPSEHLKVRIEEAAERAGLSVNAFLVTTVSAALDAPAPAPVHPVRGRGDAVQGWYA